MSGLQMTQAEREAFLAEPHIGVIALNEPGRGPLAAPIWYGYEPGSELTVLIGPQSRKGRLLSEGDRLSLVAQQESLPYRYVSVEGVVASIAPSAAEELAAMAIRYLGEEQGRAYAAANAGGENVTVAVRIERWLSIDYGKMQGDTN